MPNKANERPNAKSTPPTHTRAFKQAARGHARRPDDGTAFVPDTVIEGPTHARDDLAEEIAEDFLCSVTSGEQATEDVRNAEVPEDFGGPFVETTGREEFGDAVDEMNPEDAEPAAVPTAIRSRT